MKAVLDANVLFPFTLRDTLLRAAAEGCYRLHWSKRILDEATRNLVSSGIMTARQAGHLRAEMERAFPEAMVRGYQPLARSMKNHVKDRHVAAVAAKVRADAIVTFNVKDFRRLPESIRVLVPDACLCGLLATAPEVMHRVLREQAADLRKPPMSVGDVLARLERVAPMFVSRVRERI